MDGACWRVQQKGKVSWETMWSKAGGSRSWSLQATAVSEVLWFRAPVAGNLQQWEGAKGGGWRLEFALGEGTERNRDLTKRGNKDARGGGVRRFTTMYSYL